MGDCPRQIDTDAKRIRKQLKLTESTRLAQRARLAETWLQEEENSRYRYDVERCNSGKTVYLLRPTWLNKGFDFQINLEGFKSKSREAPSHNDIIEDLRAKKKESEERYGKLRETV